MQLKREKSPDPKNSSEAAAKRPRIETPSPLPTFKVLYYYIIKCYNILDNFFFLTMQDYLRCILLF